MGIFATITNQNLKGADEVTNLKSLVNTSKIYEPSLHTTIDRILSLDRDIPSLDFVVCVRDFFQASDIDTVNQAQSSHDIFSDGKINKAIIAYNNRNATIDIVNKKIVLDSPCSFVVDDSYAMIQGDVFITITNVISQTEFEVESVAGLNDGNVTVSQKLETINLNALSGTLDGGILRSIQELIDDKIEETLVVYDDNHFADNSSGHKVAYAITANNAVWSNVSTMPNFFEEEIVAVDPPISGQDLRVAFFSNIVTGDGEVELFGFKVFFHSLSKIQG